MAYRFDCNRETTRDGVRRIALDQIDKALAEARDPRDVDVAVHQARKRCKKLRGLIRLVRPVFPAYADENAAFRDAAAALASLRDAAVLATTYDRLMAAYGGQVDRRALRSIRARATRRHREFAAEAATAEALQLYADAMRAARERAARWQLDTGGFDALEGGLGLTCARARDAMQRACRTAGDADFHDWRKRVKYHGHHVSLLAPLWPGPMKARLAQVGRLGDLLGQHHDLAVFAAALEADPDAYGSRADVDVALGLVHRRKLVLGRAAHDIGARLHAEPPGALCGRWRAYWQAWRRNDRSC